MDFPTLWRAVRAVYRCQKSEARQILAEAGVLLADCWRRSGKVCLVVEQNGKLQRYHYNIEDFPPKYTVQKQKRTASTVLGGNKQNWNNLTPTQKARYIQIQKHSESYPWSPTGLPMRGGSRIRHKRGYMLSSTRWWEAFFDLDRESWISTKHPTIQKVFNYLMRKAGGKEYASLQTRRNILIALAHFCQKYNISPEEACTLTPHELSRLIQEFCDEIMQTGKTATAQRYLTALSVFFDKNGFYKNSDRALKLQSYGYRPKNVVPTWNIEVPEYKPTKAEVWRMANLCGQTLEGLRDRALILFLFGTGCRNGDLRAFQYGKTYHFRGMDFSFKQQLERWDGKSPIVVPVTLDLKLRVSSACKYKREHYKLLFPEAVQALKDYLVERERLHGKIADSEPLFASHGNNLPDNVWRNQPMSASTLARIVKVAARRALQGTSNTERWRGVHPHVFRNCFLEVLDGGDALTGTQILSQNDKEFVMGHRLSGSMEAYYTPQKLEELKEKWLRLGWTEKLPGTTPIELRKRQLIDWMSFLGVPQDIQEKVKAIITNWSTQEEFEEGIPVIRAIIEGKTVNVKAVLSEMPGYTLKVNEGKAYLGKPEWIRQQTSKPKQKVISVDELENALNEGWKFIASLPNGKCVVERQ